MRIAIRLFLLLNGISVALLQKGPPMMAGPIQPRFRGKLGEGIRFLCPVKADPDPIFEWYRDGERVMDYWDRYRFGGKGYSLNIQRLECEDQGTYVCKAINGFGVQEISFQLDLFDGSMQEACKSSSDEDDVSSKPVILHRQKKPKHWLKPAGNYALLKCTAVAEPLPKFHWFKDGVEITVNKSQTAKYVVRSTVLSEEDLADVSDMEGLRSTLQIGDLRGTDSGNYTCRAKNEHGTDEMTQILEVVERQVPQRPEMHPDFPPAYSWVEAGEAGVLSCKVLSEFPPEVHWLKRILPANNNGQTGPFPLLPDEEDVEASHPQFIANRTLTIGNTQYQILPSVPVKTTPDGYYASVLLLSKKSTEADAGYYVCLALNNAGYNYRQVYFNVTQPATGHSAQDGAPPAGSIADGWGDKGRADAATTAVVVIVVVCGLAGMFASCFVWKRRKSHLKGKALNGPSPPPSASSPSSRPESTSVVVGVQPGSTGASSPLLPAPLPSPASDYSAFREGLSSGSSKTTSAPSAVQHRVYYLPPRVQPGKAVTGSPRQLHHQQRFCPSGRNNNNNNLNSSGRALSGNAGGTSSSGAGRYRAVQRNNAGHHYHHWPAAQLHDSATNRSMGMMSSDDTSFHSDSFYPDWSSHPHHIRLPYPSPNNSFDQL